MGPLRVARGVEAGAQAAIDGGAEAMPIASGGEELGGV